jgi:membrane-bound hydrogenase subunit mbhJ
MGIRFQIITRSLSIHPVAVGGCNGCLIEALACLGPGYDLERFGVTLAPNAVSADVLLVSGCATRSGGRRLKRLFSGMPRPGLVVAVGTCSLGQGLFFESPAVVKPVDAVLSVNLFIPGCPPRPEALIGGLGKLVKLLRQEV